MHDIVFLYAESPLHPGGAESVGGLDLPVQREASTTLPTIWGQSLRGALRARATAEWGVDGATELFGSDVGEGGSPQPGLVSVSDGLLVALPAPTLTNTFAWVTSPLVVARLARLLTVAGMNGPQSPAGVPFEKFHAADGQRWPDRVVIGDLMMRKGANDGVGPWAAWLSENALPAFEYFRDKLRTDLLLIADDAFTGLSHRVMEVSPRVKLKPDKTVDLGPWYEESLPAETLLAALLRYKEGDGRAAGRADDVRTLLDGQILMVGGLESTGKGMAWCRLPQRGDDGAS